MPEPENLSFSAIAKSLDKDSNFLFLTTRLPFWTDSHRSAQLALKRKKSEISASSTLQQPWTLGMGQLDRGWGLW